jgi:hypothetical protein
MDMGWETGWTVGGEGGRGTGIRREKRKEINLSCRLRRKVHAFGKSSSFPPLFTHFFAYNAGIQARNIFFNLVFRHIFDKINERRKLCVILPNGEILLLASRQRALRVFFGELVAEDGNQPAKKGFNSLKGREDEWDTIEVGLLIKDTLLSRIGKDKRIVPVLGGGRMLLIFQRSKPKVTRNPNYPPGLALEKRAAGAKEVTDSPQE